MLLKIGILLIMSGGWLFFNGIWILFLSKKKTHIKQILKSRIDDLTKSEKQEQGFYKLEFFLFKASFFIFGIGLLITLLHLFNFI